MRLQDLAIHTNTQLDTNSVLLERFKAHDRVVWDPKTDLYSYKVSKLPTRIRLAPNLFLFSTISHSGIKPRSSPKSNGIHEEAAAYPYVH